ncbi:MAG TPA: shikimate kinase [Thermoanaerobaculia bacterium]|jgi:shikimate kinase|nr:shikimate kinase [Thermoanaerobaculia bacterium]
MRILLTGFMGAGKTTVGRLLAEQLRLDFVDLDQEIESASGLRVREIFERHGEPEFRALERRLLAEALGRDEIVIAAGGGTLADAETLELARRSGVVVWLNPTFSTLVARIGPRGKSDRPLFGDETQAFDLYRSRLPSYRQADLRIDVGPDEQAREVAARIALLLARPVCTT